jgi:hypothetical protein
LVKAEDWGWHCIVGQDLSWHPAALPGLVLLCAYPKINVDEVQGGKFARSAAIRVSFLGAKREHYPRFPNQSDSNREAHILFVGPPDRYILTILRISQGLSA